MRECCGDHGSTPESPWLRPAGRALVLSPEAVARLSRVLERLSLDPGVVRFRWGFTARATAFVIGRLVTVDRRRFAALSAARQLELIAHELVHVAQYAALGASPTGVGRFLWRYLPEYHLDPNNYRLPEALARTPLAEVAVLDPRYTLDQIAERFRWELREPETSQAADV